MLLNKDLNICIVLQGKQLWKELGEGMTSNGNGLRCGFPLEVGSSCLLAFLYLVQAQVSKTCDESVRPVSGFKPGPAAAKKMLDVP